MQGMGQPRTPFVRDPHAKLRLAGWQEGGLDSSTERGSRFELSAAGGEAVARQK